MWVFFRSFYLPADIQHTQCPCRFFNHHIIEKYIKLNTEDDSELKEIRTLMLAEGQQRANPAAGPLNFEYDDGEPILTSTVFEYTLKSTSGVLFFLDGRSLRIGVKTQRRRHRLHDQSTAEEEYLVTINFWTERSQYSEYARQRHPEQARDAGPQSRAHAKPRTGATNKLHVAVKIVGSRVPTCMAGRARRVGEHNR